MNGNSNIMEYYVADIAASGILQVQDSEVCIDFRKLFFAEGFLVEFVDLHPEADELIHTVVQN